MSLKSKENENKRKKEAKKHTHHLSALNCVNAVESGLFDRFSSRNFKDLNQFRELEMKRELEEVEKEQENANKNGAGCVFFCSKLVLFLFIQHTNTTIHNLTMFQLFISFCLFVFCCRLFGYFHSIPLQLPNASSFVCIMFHLVRVLFCCLCVFVRKIYSNTYDAFCKR